MKHDTLFESQREDLERLKLATDVLLSEAPDIPDSLEVELTLFRHRLERALLLPKGGNVIPA